MLAPNMDQKIVASTGATWAPTKADLNDMTVLDEVVSCRACHSICQDPVRLWNEGMTCDHIYCRTCITNVCCICPQHGTIQPSTLHDHYITNLEFFCPY